jgi:hypothetical protein
LLHFKKNLIHILENLDCFKKDCSLIKVQVSIFAKDNFTSESKFNFNTPKLNLELGHARYPKLTNTSLNFGLNI